MIDAAIVAAYVKNAAAMGIRVAEAPDMDGALRYALDVCAAKDFCELLPVAEGQAVGDIRRASVKTIAAPGLDDGVLAQLTERGAAFGFEIFREGLRDRLAGVDMALSIADLGIAETATCAVASSREEARIASMVCEIYVVVLPKDRIVASLDEAGPYLERCAANGAAYTAFISGPSRTADIERILALGVHGPLEMHVVLTEA